MLAVLLIGAYILGSIPTGYWIGKARGIDITKMGSGSTGATNVWRCVGKVEGLAVMVIDLLKGYLPVLYAIHVDQGEQAAQWTFGIPHLVPVLVATLAIVGHSKSMFLGFKGGKSAATGLGTMLAFNPAVGGLTFACWMAVVLITKIVSLASISAALLNVVFMALFNNPLAYIIYAMIGWVYVTVRHTSNIKRLLAGTEPKLGDKPKQDDTKS
jgi:glycerol-3-phosphate acyltransferase PlsY